MIFDLLILVACIFVFIGCIYLDDLRPWFRGVRQRIAEAKVALHAVRRAREAHEIKYQIRAERRRLERELDQEFRDLDE
jgi:hypothetical protein